MNNHLKKTIAPVIVSLCIIGYYAAVGVFLIKLNIPAIIKVIALAVSIIITIVVIVVLAGRIKEIKGGEEDDLGKY